MTALDPYSDRYCLITGSPLTHGARVGVAELETRRGDESCEKVMRSEGACSSKAYSDGMRVFDACVVIMT